MSVYVEPVRSDFWQLYKEPGSAVYDDPLGPLDCQTHSTARNIMRANEGIRPAGISGVWPPTGEIIRRYTGDTVGGTTHAQMAVVAANRYGTSLTVRYAVPFEDALDALEETRGVQISVWYDRIRRSAFAGSNTFRENHELFFSSYDRAHGLLRAGVDPLAGPKSRTDQQGLFQGPGDYPVSLIRAAAGDLNVSRIEGNYVRLGTGLCYAMWTKPTAGAPVVILPPPPIIVAPVPVEAHLPMNTLNGHVVQAILATPQTKVRLLKGTVIYKGDFKTPLTKASRDMTVVLSGYPASGWRTVVISTAAGSPDGQQRTVEAFVPKGAALPVH